MRQATLVRWFMLSHVARDNPIILEIALEMEPGIPLTGYEIV